MVYSLLAQAIDTGPTASTWVAVATIMSGGLASLAAAVRWAIPFIFQFLEKRDNQQLEERKSRDQDIREIIDKFELAVREFRQESRDNLKVVLAIQEKTVLTLADLTSTVRNLGDEVHRLGEAWQEVDRVQTVTKGGRKFPPSPPATS